MTETEQTVALAIKAAKERVIERLWLTCCGRDNGL